MGGDTTVTTVVGVVADVKEAGLDKNARSQMFYPLRARFGENLAVVARSTLPSRTLLANMTEAVRSVDRSQAIYEVRMLDDVRSGSVAPQRANTLLISLFGALALAVSMFGVYAVTSYSVTQRSREFGIRAALGASSRDIVRHIAGEMTWTALGGVVLGAGLAWALSRVMRSLVFGVTVHDTGTFAAAPALLLIAVLLATLIPARRATRVNPVDVIRED
jgi:ABC-type antimicrobial peptide transport system permease subunit